MTQEKEHLVNWARAGLLFFSIFYSLSLLLSGQIMLSVIFAASTISIIRSFFSAKQVPGYKTSSLGLPCFILWLGISITLATHQAENSTTVLYSLFPISLATFILLGLKRGLMLSIGALLISIPFSINSFVQNHSYLFLSFSVFLCLLGFALRYVNKLEQNLEQAKTTDPITGCTSIQQFKKHVQNAVQFQQRYNSEVSCIVFKSHTDSEKYLQKEQFLKEVAQICQSRIRQTDIICHYSSDNFLILLPNTPHSNADNLGTDLVQACEAYKFTHGRTSEASHHSFSYDLSSYSENISWEVWFSQLTHDIPSSYC
jgi:diguanylate cyclase (GGDEF)-like protein